MTIGGKFSRVTRRCAVKLHEREGSRVNSEGSFGTTRPEGRKGLMVRG